MRLSDGLIMSVLRRKVAKLTETEKQLAETEKKLNAAGRGERH